MVHFLMASLTFLAYFAFDAMHLNLLLYFKITVSNYPNSTMYKVLIP